MPQIKNNSGRSRKFCCISYLNEFQIIKCLSEHLSQIRAYAYILHDKDTFNEKDEKKNPDNRAGELKISHYHLIIVTYNACTVSAVKRWFSGYVDSNGPINTNVEICNDIYAYDDYLTHEDKKSLAENKVIYDRENVVYSNKPYFQAHESANYDNSVLAVEMLLKGVPLRTVYQIFGKDVIYHYSQIKNVVRDTLIWEDKKIKDFNQLLDFEELGNFALDLDNTKGDLF